MSNQKTVHFIIERQDSPTSAPYTEEFVLPYRPAMNVVSSLMEIQKNPVTKDGKKTTSVVWECNCLEKVCGACMMVINGKAQQACAALIDHLQQPIKLQPARTFPVVRDLMIDRGVMFESLKKVNAWVEVDGTYPVGPGPRQNPKTATEAYEISRCMTCGCCMEACPNVNRGSEFIGPAPMGQAHLFNLHPIGEYQKEERMEALMEKGGLASCGNSQNCAEACPKDIKLTTYIAKLNRAVNKHAIMSLLDK
ncbi:succinate dehydrogenase iron-sulfur subunit [Azotosporobacter soli]|jgi:succinate dehydrogenase / fumarate reductase, iron-sulfur subunit|uniref:succinate dehydrogenase iron-sulfur subunit n=1 Tax=Azotosporobacter soli TaxID=3055040 RepID=UPI0031FF4462